MAQGKKTLEFSDVPELLHVNADLEGNDIPDELSTERFHKLATAIADFIEASVRDIHGLPQDNEQHLCGSCVMNVLQNTMMEILERGHVSRTKAAKTTRRVAKDLFEVSIKMGGAASALEELLSRISGDGDVKVEVINLGPIDLDETPPSAIN